METVYSIMSTMIFLIVIVLLWFGYYSIQRLIIRRKFSEYIKYFKLFKYNYVANYTYKGKGLIYRKQLHANEMNRLLNLYGFKDCSISSGTAIFENLAIVKFPYWEERFDIIVKEHGGTRFILFYSIEIEDADKRLYRPYNVYICEDYGEYFEECIPIDGDTIHGTIACQKRDALKAFVEKEIKYWQKDHII